MQTQLSEDESNAQRLIEYFEREKFDYSMLLYLQLPQSQIDAHPVLKTIQDICTDFGVTRMRHHFFKTVEAYIISSGIREITPLSFVSARNKGDLHKEYQKKKSKWGLHSPFCVQVYGSDFVGSVFIITRTWQDGLHRLLEILKDGSVSFNNNVYNACGAVEHITDEFSLSFALFDCEILASQCEGRVSIQQIRDCVLNFPQTIGEMFLEAGVIDMESVVKFVIKDKCRHIGSDMKISYHFLSSVIGTKSLHEQAISSTLEPHHNWMNYVKDCIRNSEKTKHKSFHFIPTEKLCNPQDPQSVLLFLDTKALPGGPNGFTTSFSRKKTDDKFPVLMGQEMVCLGRTLDKTLYRYPMQHDLQGSHLSDKVRLEMLWQSCYTTPRLHMTAYSEAFIEDLKLKVENKKKSRVGTETVQSGPHPLEAGEAEEEEEEPTPSAVAGRNLPKWFLSGLVLALGWGGTQKRPAVRSTLPSIRERWVGSLPKSLRKSVAVYHVHPCWCALRLAEGELELHEKNGTIVAVDDKSCVYLACATGDHKITRSTSLLMNVVNKNSPSDEDGNVVSIVAGDVAREKLVHWVVLSKADLDTLKKKAGATTTTATTTAPESVAINATKDGDN